MNTAKELIEKAIDKIILLKPVFGNSVHRDTAREAIDLLVRAKVSLDGVVLLSREQASKAQRACINAVVYCDCISNPICEDCSDANEVGMYLLQELTCNAKLAQPVEKKGSE